MRFKRGVASSASPPRNDDVVMLIYTAAYNFVYIITYFTAAVLVVLNP
jgi:hypothetical protein